MAISVSNLPEAIGSASEMRAAGRRDPTIVRLWVAVAAVCALATTVVGYAIADNVSDNPNAAIDGFAAGALLAMLVDSMIPDAAQKSGRVLLACGVAGERERSRRGVEGVAGVVAERPDAGGGVVAAVVRLSISREGDADLEKPLRARPLKKSLSAPTLPWLST